MPISTSFDSRSSNSTSSLPGTEQCSKLAAIVTILSITFRETWAISDKKAPVIDVAHAILWTNITPASPLLSTKPFLVLPTATSSATITSSTFIPRDLALSEAKPKCNISPV